MITISPSGRVFEAENNQTVLEAALDNNINLPYGCRNGACGACKGKVLSGEVDYSGHDIPALTETDRAAGYALFCCAKPLGDLTIECREISLADGIRPRILPTRVESLDKISHDVMVMHLKLPSNERLQFMAGQYIEFLLKDGKRRAFSLANAPHDDSFLELHLRLIPGGAFTEYVFNEMPQKSIMRIEGPFGTFFLRENTQKPIIFIAGGTGFAPIKGIIEHMLHKGIQRDMTLYWGAKTLADLYMPALPQAWANAYPHIRFIPVLSEPLETDGWKGRTGLVHQAVLEDFEDLGEHEVYCCGAPAMVDVAHQSFVSQGLPEDSFFSDAFTFANPIPKSL